MTDTPQNSDSEPAGRPPRTSEEDREAGWTDSDWTSGNGPNEAWRFQLSRKLTADERAYVADHAQDAWDAEDECYSLEKTLEIMRRATLAGDPIHIKRCRKNFVESTKVKGNWEPIFPEPEDIEITIPE